MMTRILDARENRANKIKSLYKSESIIICIKANIPGEDKNIKEAHLLVRLFASLVQNKYKIRNNLYFESDDGPYVLLNMISNQGIKIKKEMVLLEDTQPLGRFIDIDIFDQADQSLSRTTLGIQNRKCYICGEDAHQCSRAQKHSVLQLLEFIQLKTKSFLSYQIEHQIHNAIMKELELDDKFGLVSKTSMGSHNDMDYQLMRDAEHAILPNLVDLFLLGYDARELETLLSVSRSIGIDAEQKMFQATHGINAYKGLIYILGLTLLSLGYTLAHHQTFDHIFSNIEIMTQSVFDEFKQTAITPGLKAYQNHNITGIRGEAYRGIPSVRSALELLTDTDEQTLRNVLKHLILISEDTVFLNRAKTIENYQYIKDVLKKVDISNQQELQAFNQLAIKEHLSFGGSADLLIVTIFLKSIQSIYF